MDKKPERLMPEVRFKGFTDDWEQHKLGDFGNVQMNKRIFKSQTLDSGDVPFYKIGTFGKKADAYISSELYEEYRNKYPYPKDGDLLISASGSIGKIVEYKGQRAYYQDSNIVWLDHDNRILNLFLKAFFQIVKWNGTEGSTIKRLYNKNILNTEIILPKIKEQTAVGKLIEKFDYLITLQQRKLEQLKQLKKAMLQYLLTTEKKSDPLIRNKNYNNKWDTTTFSKLLNYERPENYIVTNTNYRKNGIPVLTANKSFILGYTNEPNVYNKGEAIIFDDFTLENKFVNFPFMIKSSAIKILTSKVNYSLYFIFQLLQHTKFIKEGHARHYISVVQKQIVKIPPSYEEQESISDTFSRIQSLIKLQQNKIDQYTTLKKYLLQKMFI
ncbi:hypothetical protein N134_04705 [Limosilactobacillus reuteri TD1]|uniref:Type I restriction modification DNA specificity domain-containing protein n=6 Tax=Limosilactobacillus reuteri TaxID=1598 RepID=S5NRW1_LIMRT|nr:restriction endonuclease subunit S [Limosilactobacillus reuteri]AGR65120.1 hypothetical protein N134_04705 [Limosilactobacillus reuteri TD1]